MRTVQHMMCRRCDVGWNGAVLGDRCWAPGCGLVGERGSISVQYDADNRRQIYGHRFPGVMS